MIAAIYARQSSVQHNVAAEDPSIMRQIEHARAYAARKGWTVLEEHIYADEIDHGAGHREGVNG